MSGCRDAQMSGCRDPNFEKKNSIDLF
jgi:hypothetical protein